MKVSIISFSQRGAELANRIAELLGSAGDAASCARGFGDGKADHVQWTADAFAASDALVFVGACGIAVRSIAPHVASKAADPAVVVVDERGLHCIALLSGHIGGANLLAARIAAGIGADPVITTATDVNGLFAVDSWAVSQGMAVVNPAQIKAVSAKLLAGGTVRVRSEMRIEGEAPEQVVVVEPSEPDESADVVVGVHALGAVDGNPPLLLAPKALVAGMGCRRGTPQNAIEARFAEVCRREGFLPQAFATLATIDVKANEEGLLAFAAARGMQVRCFSAEALNSVEGSFHSSNFVQETVGVDNVCERAVAAAGAKLVVHRDAGGGVTVAVGRIDAKLEWPSQEAGQPARQAQPQSQAQQQPQLQSQLHPQPQTSTAKATTASRTFPIGTTRKEK